MIYLSKPQKRFLAKLLETGSINCSAMSEDTLQIAKYLESLGLLTATRESSSFYDPHECETKTFYGAYLSVEISEKGKSYFAEVHSECMRFLIPVAISICALVISILSLLATLPICPLLPN